MFLNTKKRKKNFKALLIAVFILFSLFVLQVPYSNSALAGYENDELESISGIEAKKQNKSLNNNWNLILVNNKNLLPRDFRVDLLYLPNDYRVDYRIATYVEKMLEDAKKDGVELRICSAYRSVSLQNKLYTRKIKAYSSLGLTKAQAQKKATSIVAVPGTSEHHTGLALDIVAQDYKTLDNGFEKTAAFAWLNENAQNYGFILRYPKDKQKITGVIYEPWHYRYVGEKIAKDIKNRNITLEEYLERF